MKKKTKEQKADIKIKPKRKYGGGAQKGNKHATIFDTPAKRKKLLEAVCQHLESGLSTDCFPHCCWKTVRKTIEDYPEDFPEERIQEALRRGQMLWEQLGIRGAYGKIANFNAASWIFNMKNRYGWKDKKEIDHQGSIDLSPKIIRDDIPDEES